MAFAHSHGFSIDTFNAESHSHTHFHSRPPPDPMQILRKSRAVEATHISRTAAYAPKCKPGTRAKVIKDMGDWVGKEGVETPILWFQGPAGGGKTCIMREVVAQCEKQGFIAATYFFSTRVAGLNHEGPFIGTIAHQLCMKLPALAQKMSEAILACPDMFKESLEFQAERLLLGPFSTLESLSSLRIIVAVDGLDECRDPNERVHLIRVLRKVADSIQNLLVIIASRPEVDIRTEFACPYNHSITHFLRLQDYDGTSDIRDYLCDEFCSIRDTHPAKHSIPFDWPLEKVLEVLVENSSGSFIYPSTVVKYVRNPRRNPVAMLDDVLSLQVTNSNPLAELDALYHLILHHPDVDIQLLRRLLHCIVGLSDDGDCPDSSSISAMSGTVLVPKILDDLLSLPIGTTSTAFCDLHSLISVPSVDAGDSGPLRFHHKSLEDYLCSPARSGNLYQSVEETRINLTQACISYLKNWSGRPFHQDLAPRTPALDYSDINWVVHLCQLACTLRRNSEAELDPFDLVPESIKSFDPLDLWKIELRSGTLWRCRMVAVQHDLHTLIASINGVRSKHSGEALIVFNSALRRTPVTGRGPFGAFPYAQEHRNF